jgi:Hydantoinase/oxoprolinase N-terminal region
MYYVGVDIGGTFTDCVLVDEQGDHRTAKVLSTRGDPAAGALAAEAAEREYGVVPGNAARTRALRARRLAARRAEALPPAVPVQTVPADVPLRVLAGELAVVERDGRPQAFVTVTGRAVLAPAGGNFKHGCARAGPPPAHDRSRVRHPAGPGRLPDAVPGVPVPRHRPARGL